MSGRSQRLPRAAAVLGAIAALACAGEGAAVRRAREALESAPRRAGNLKLSCEPAGAVVSVDGVPRGTCEDFSQGAAGVGEGLHRVEVQKDGYWPYVTYYEPSGARVSLAIQLRPRAAPKGEAQ